MYQYQEHGHRQSPETSTSQTTLQHARGRRYQSRDQRLQAEAESIGTSNIFALLLYIIVILKSQIRWTLLTLFPSFHWLQTHNSHT